MKRSISTLSGTLRWSRTALLTLGMLAVIFTFAGPAPAQVYFPWATKINFSCMTEVQEISLIKLTNYIIF